MISCDLGQNHGSKKTDWLSGVCSKVSIKSTNKAKYLLFGTTKDRIPSFVTKISHKFTFVPWAVIWPTCRIWPFVNQFFCSLYVSNCTYKMLLNEGYVLTQELEFIDKLLCALPCDQSQSDCEPPSDSTNLLSLPWLSRPLDPLPCPHLLIPYY